MKINVRDLFETEIAENNSEQDLNTADNINTEPESAQTIEAEHENEIQDAPDSKANIDLNTSAESNINVETKHSQEPSEEIHEKSEKSKELKVSGKACEEPVSPDLQQSKDEKPSLYQRYGVAAGISAAFIILIFVVIIYTNMIPREVNATINGELQTSISKSYTIGEFLREKNIEICSEDYISMPLTTYIYDGIAFEMQHATDFQITADGKTRKYKSLANTVGEALKEENIKLGKDDIVKPGLDEALTKDMQIVVKRVVFKEKTVEKSVPFKTIKKDDDSMNQGESKVVTKGVKGKDKVTYKIKYIDGKEASRKEIDRKHLKKPVDKVVAEGTKISFNGSSYSRKLVVKAYAYTGGGRTAMGTKARVGEIAVDPSVIPLGSKVYIEGVGERRAEDTGGNIKGNTIDIYMNSQSECIRWGSRYVTIYIQ